MPEDIPVRDAKKRYYKRSADKWRTYQKEYRKTAQGRLQRLHWHLKNVAAQEGVPYDLTIADISEYPAECPVLQIPITVGEGTHDLMAYRKKKHDGFTKENVLWVSKKAFWLLAGDFTVNDLTKAIAFIQENHA